MGIAHVTRRFNTQGVAMNKDQLKGTAKDLGGKLQEEAGKLVGSNNQQIKGLKNQLEGKIQKSAGDIKEVIDNTLDAAKGKR
jgi:uncharacterized protein YjbJ (UPF0337 family)